MRRNFEIKITYPDGTSETFNRDFSITMELIFDSTNDNTTPQYGIIGNTGHITFIDKNDTVANKIKTLPVNNLFQISIMLNGNEIKSFNVDSNIDYDIYTKNISFNIVSELQKLQDLYISLDLNLNVNYLTMLDIYTFLKLQTVGFDFSIDENLLNWLGTKNIKYSFLNYDSLWNHWNNFCNACQLQMFQDKNGLIKLIRYDGGNL